MSQAIETTRIPQLSEIGTDLLRVSTGRKICWIAAPFLAFAGYWLFAASEYWVLAIGALIVLSFVTYGSTSHDLVHGSLRLNRRTNDLLLAVIEGLSLRSGHAYQSAHLNHHARFPHEDDIEANAARMSLMGALLDGMVLQVRIYAWSLQHPNRKRNWIIAEGIAVVALIAAAVLAMPWTVAPAVYVSLMIAGSWIIPLITSYIPHNPAGNSVLEHTRVFRGWIFRLIAFDHLYHLEHHLYPAVPHQNWPELARRLDPWFRKQGLKPVRSWF